MKRITPTFILVAISLLGFTQNLIINGTFEDEQMQLNCAGWYDLFGKSLLTTLDSEEVCDTIYFSKSNENNWSLMIYSSFPGPNYIETYITGREGKHIYKLKYDMLGIGVGLGTGYFGKLVNGEFENRKSQTDTASIWRTFNLIDTIATLPTDTIVVGFAGDDCDLCISTAYFDNISFSTDIIPLSTNNIENITAITVYPNPAKEVLNFKIDQSLSENYKLHIFNAIGQQVKMINLNKASLKINPNLNSGLYFYYLQNNKKQTLTTGKFVIE